MKYHRDPTGRMHHIAFGIRIVLRRAKILILWFCQAWIRAWRDLFGVFGQAVSLLFNRQVWAVAALIGIVWVVVAGPPLLDRVINVDKWQTISCNSRGVHVFVNAPRSIASGDRRYLEITVHNETGGPLRNVQVSVSSDSGLLLFDETNTVMIETLEMNVASTKALTFRVANLQTFEEVQTVIMYCFEREPNRFESHYCSEPPTLVNSTWRRAIVQLRAVPDVLGTGATYIGYLGTLVTGLLAITGKIGPVVRSVVSVLRSSNRQADRQSGSGESRG